jgi:hypothetical protein
MTSYKYIYKAESVKKLKCEDCASTYAVLAKWVKNLPLLIG